jgi:hypothetical protein
MQEQVDALGVKLAQEVQQVDQAATQGNRPGGDAVDVAGGRRPSAADRGPGACRGPWRRDTGVLEKLDHAPAVARNDLFQFASLVVGRLLARGDPEIDRDALLCQSFVGRGRDWSAGHRFPPHEPVGINRRAVVSRYPSAKGRLV